MRLMQQKRREQYFRDKIEFTLGPAELKRMIDEHETVVILDVREGEAYRKGHVPGAINIPHEDWPSRLFLESGKTHVVYCYNQQCHLAAKVALEIAKRGFKVMELEGGMPAWEAFGYSVEKEEQEAAA
jgi:rhodanese-related sulfurtransferase